ncbi:MULTISPECIES: amidohydrolase family protein [unclassified Undibacterium]|uniref:amidohydrolase family protein n=1 Tax=unclassified Undibacterium TaxID=2630295 RepID=UPI002AC8A611|nr:MULTISPECIES: amidohydrolase family protein [unclassified Undibacterium]MEB0138434.1 amidohydrolase family protein [Undibacterium sp. CCC2.1]MEB0171309.1 amidohydrolase family protein [Undibacterium sp. CCC1.1]MEB0176453.1 amidohydrolase family protein [Undibacterium sp. CCC3.4]MEB0214063.1 amidohydrolase family protein [Undibacterium sp. 5I2]WPX43676.1 amidohydrolase family protein [Undibacterium sp. CCC3.4]
MQVEVHQLAQALQPVLEPLLAAGLNVVVDHFGRPDPLLGITDPGFRYLLALGASQNVWVKLSAAYRNGAEGRGEQIALAAMPLLLAQFGPQRLLWGSDWPHTLYEASAHYGQQTLMLEQYLPNQAARRIVLRDSPAALFGFSA